MINKQIYSFFTYKDFNKQAITIDKNMFSMRAGEISQHRADGHFT